MTDNTKQLVERLREIATESNSLPPERAALFIEAADTIECLVEELKDAENGHSEAEGLLRRRAEERERDTAALRYIAGEDVAGMEGHQRPQDVARSVLAAQGGKPRG